MSIDTKTIPAPDGVDSEEWQECLADAKLVYDGTISQKEAEKRS